MGFQVTSVGFQVTSWGLLRRERGTSLAGRVRVARRRQQRLAVLLLAPAAIFVIMMFVAPIVMFSFRAVDNGALYDALPRTIGALAQWDRAALPGDEAFSAMAADLHVLDPEKAALLGQRLNYVIPGYRSLITRTSSQVRTLSADWGRSELLEIDKRWGERSYWIVIANDGDAFTPYFALAAIDLKVTDVGGIGAVSADRAVFRNVLVRTFWISGIVTLLCLLIGFPLAWVLANVPVRAANLLLILVLLPFWTSTLVRTTAWVILLQREGLVNQLLLWLGIIREPLTLIFNRAGVYVAMTHVLVPFLILPLYSVMKGIPREHMRAAASLGAPPIAAFLRVYLPQTMPGVAAGCTLVFVIALGFYVTPVLVGGPGDQMISYFIAFYTNEAVNWGMASALATLLLICVAIFYTGAGAVLGFDRLKVR